MAMKADVRRGIGQTEFRRENFLGLRGAMVTHNALTCRPPTFMSRRSFGTAAPRHETIRAPPIGNLSRAIRRSRLTSGGEVARRAT